MSTWYSRFGNLMSGRFSPFGHPAQSKHNHKVSDSDFSYITAEDLADHSQEQQQQQDRSNLSHVTTADSTLAPPDSDHYQRGPHGSELRPARSRSPSVRHNSRSHHSHHDATRDKERNRPPRDTDVLHFRYKRNAYAVHFPAYSIDDGHLSIGAARDQAARKLDIPTHDAKRVKLLWDGRNLKDDNLQCRDMGIRSSDDASILCVVGSSSSARSDDEDGSSTDGSVTHDGGGKSKRKHRSKNKHHHRHHTGGRDDSVSSAAMASREPRPEPRSGGIEHLPIPTGSHPLHNRVPSPGPSNAPSSRQPSPAPPQGPQAKLSAIQSRFETELLPGAKDFINSPPREKEKREFEHKRLTETILAQVLIKLDGVETEGDEEARAKRKGLVKEMQQWLTKLDVAVKEG